MSFLEVFKTLNKFKVEYVVAGGAAVVLHGYGRLTQDLDLIILLEKNNLGKLHDALSSIDFVPKVPVTKEQLQDEKLRDQWKNEKGMIVFSFVEKNPPFILVDIFINDKKLFGRVDKCKKIANVGGVNVPLISIEELIRLKKIAGRNKDIDDIVQLRAIKKRLNGHD